MNAPIVAPIDTERQLEVIRHTEHTIARAASLFAVDLPMIPICFDLKGRSAGIYSLNAGQRKIRYNPWIFAKYYRDNLQLTVPHEVAHYVVEKLFGQRRIKPHGQEWQNVMIAMGCEPRVTADFSLDGVPQRKIKRFDYNCACGSHSLSSIRHNRIETSGVRYHCRRCRKSLTRASSE